MGQGYCSALSLIQRSLLWRPCGTCWCINGCDTPTAATKPLHFAGHSAVSKLWGGRGLLQCFEPHPADFLVETLRDMLAHQPDGLRWLLTRGLSPGFAELLTSKLEERAAESGGKDTLFLP